MVMLTLRQTESGSGDQLLNELDEVFMEAGYPKEAAVFSRIDFVAAIHYKDGIADAIDNPI